MARSTFWIRRVPDRPPGWWVFSRTEWGEGKNAGQAGGLTRDIPFRTRKGAMAWIREQFPHAEISGSS